MMMKRLLSTAVALLLGAALLGGALPVARADADVRVVYGTVPDYPYGRLRVALREGPSTDARVLLRVYNGVAVVVEGSAKGGFVKVRLGDSTTGYMMEEYLLRGVGGDERNLASLAVDIPDPREAAALRQGPSATAPALRTVQQDSVFLVAAGDDWHYVREDEYDGNGNLLRSHYGYMRADHLTESENLKAGVVKAGDRLMTLRKRPDKSSDIVGQYYPGTQFVHLVQMDTERDWRKVRVGATVGYTNDPVLASPDPEVMAARQVMTLRTAGEVTLRQSPSDSAAAVSTLAAGTAVQVQGFIGKWYQVWADPYYGYVRQDALQ